MEVSEYVAYIMSAILIVAALIAVAMIMRHEEYKKEMLKSISPDLSKIFDKLRVSFNKILIVDDDVLQRELIELKPVPEDCKVHQAATKAEALELINSNEYDLIFLDIKMADNGTNILKTMRENNNQTSVIIITGYANKKVYEFSEQYDVPVIEKQNLIPHIDFWSKTFKLKHL